jgi:splicing factor U2AF 35 kDa subunit
MAKHLARIHGTEEDKVNCPFYFKIGACRHEDRCSRLHHKPAFSPTILLKHMYKNPPGVGGGAGPGATTTIGPPGQAPVDLRQAYEDFLDFYEDVFLELSKYGRLEGLHVVDNLGDHMIGHVYAKYYDEEEAADALEHLTAPPGRYYDGRILVVEYSPVTDFREARCRDFDEGNCSRAGFCNFLHVKPVPVGLIRSLETDAEDARIEAEARRRRREHSSSSRHNDKKRKHDKKERKHSKRDRRYSPSRSNSPSPPPASSSSSMPPTPYGSSTADGLPPSFAQQHHQYPPLPPPGGAGLDRGGK